MQDLKKWFRKARLSLKLEREPPNPNFVDSEDIFQMTIAMRGKTNKREYFRLYKGHEHNHVQVIDTDPESQQLILMVREPPREFISYELNDKTGEYENVKRMTPNRVRKYLLGMDEAHLFISELPQEGAINKVKEAHKVLKPEYVIASEKDREKVKRQGEWFFVPVTPKERKIIVENENFAEEKHPIGGTIWGNVHIADKLLNLNDETYVKGKIKHVEHKTIKLRDWFKVLRNTEVMSRLGVIGWID